MGWGYTLIGEVYISNHSPPHKINVIWVETLPSLTTKTDGMWGNTRHLFIFTSMCVTVYNFYRNNNLLMREVTSYAAANEPFIRLEILDNFFPFKV